MKKRMRSFLEDIIRKGELDEIFFEENDKHVIIIFSKTHKFAKRAASICYSIEREFEEHKEETKGEKPGYIG